MTIDTTSPKWFVLGGDEWKRIDFPETTYYNAETFNACNGLTTIIVDVDCDSSENWSDIDYVI